MADALADADDGELFLEYRQSEGLGFDDGRLKTASFDTTQGFGLRAVADEATGYAHAAELSEAAIRRAAATVKAVSAGHGGTAGEGPASTNAALYAEDNPLNEIPFERKVALLQEIDAYARGLDPRVVQVIASITGEWQAIQIIRADGRRAADIRPLIRLNVSVVAAEGERMETGGHGVGGRTSYTDYFVEDAWKAQVDEAFRQALVNLESVSAPAGEMPVVLGPGWPGILLHEAIGHGWRATSTARRRPRSPASRRADRLAGRHRGRRRDDRRPARLAKHRRRGDADPEHRADRGRILAGYMQDRMNARLMGARPTGNGRRESFAHSPMPRMTNTYMLSGDKSPEEIVAAVPKGLYAVNFGGGQVDITSGKFVFSASEAYLIEDGAIGAPVKGATLIGNGPDALTRVKMVGDDMSLDPGVGTCGKEGQGVPVGVGQPTLLIDNLTVGGTAA